MNWREDSYGWVGEWSARRAALSPTRTAIVDAGTDSTYTYADLEQRATQTAALLGEYGVSDGERVALVSRNRIEAFDCFFGTGKTGGVLAPLSHRLAPPTLAALLETIDPRLLIVESPFVEPVEAALEAVADGTEPAVLELEVDGATKRWDSFAEQLPEASLEAGSDGGSTGRGRSRSLSPSPTLSLEDPHLLLHTGGSTGVPKVTTITHGSIYWNSLNTITAWGLSADDLTPMVFPLFHTGGWNVLSIPLIHMGATLVIDREVDAGRILTHIESHGATVLVAVPTVLRSLTTHPHWADTDLSTLRFVKSGGGPCRESVIRAWRERDIDISQGYGLTEIGPNNFAMPDAWPDGKVSSVGKPVMHADARIVDAEGSVLEGGETGELELRGPHAAAGYWGATDSDESTFDGDWVSTGDLARVDADGFYHIVGRKKTMFVSGGENVYPPAVEDAIADHPAVADVVVIGVADEQWGTVGKAVVEPAEGWGGGSSNPDADADAGADATATADQPPLTLSELTGFLEGRLSRYAMPAHLEFVDELPTSGPSKIDRAAVEEQFSSDT